MAKLCSLKHIRYGRVKAMDEYVSKQYMVHVGGPFSVEDGLPLDFLRY